MPQQGLHMFVNFPDMLFLLVFIYFAGVLLVEILPLLFQDLGVIQVELNQQFCPFSQIYGLKHTIEL